MQKGQRVEQGQRVGAVGTTGWSTGPHLHFEFRVNGQHQDPLQVAKTSETVTLDPASRAAIRRSGRSRCKRSSTIAQTLSSGRGLAE